MHSEYEGTISKRQKESIAKKSGSSKSSKGDNAAKRQVLKGVAEEKTFSIKAYIPPIASCSEDLIKNKKIPGIASYDDFVRVVRSCGFSDDINKKIIEGIGNAMALINSYYDDLKYDINKVIDSDQIDDLDSYLQSAADYLQVYTGAVSHLSPADKAKFDATKINDVYLAISVMVGAVQYYNVLYEGAVPAIPYGQDAPAPN